jgi:spermidine/putrescine transport system permease protein
METLPTAIFGSVKQGIKPNIMAISTMLLAVSAIFVTLSYFINRIGQRARG